MATQEHLLMLVIEILDDNQAGNRIHNGVLFLEIYRMTIVNFWMQVDNIRIFPRETAKMIQFDGIHLLGRFCHSFLSLEGTLLLAYLFREGLVIVGIIETVCLRRLLGELIHRRLLLRVLWSVVFLIILLLWLRNCVRERSICDGIDSSSRIVRSHIKFEKK
jgi:hypothetical protein